MSKIFFPLVMVAVLLLAACDPSPAPIPESPTPTTPSPTAAPALTAPPALSATPTQVPTPRAISGQSAVVAYIKDGDIQLWDEATGQSETIFSSGDVIAVTVSDDGQVVAFLRRFYFEADGFDLHEQSALWAVDLNGENPRELVTVEELRRLLNATVTDSTNLPQMEWIPGTHRLLYTAWTYFVVAEGESHATPAGLYLVDADTLTNTVLLPAAGNNLRFASSPNGQQIALISTTGLSFINADGSNYRPEVFPYAPVGFGGQAFPTGVWTQDGQAFLLATYLEKTPQTDPGLAIWRVPLEGTPERLTDAVIATHQDSVTFSPDGRQVAFARVVSQNQSGYFVSPLVPEAGPLIVPKSVYLFLKNLHWSPAGVAYAIHEGALDQICPDAAQDVEVCNAGPVLGEQLAEIYWIDGTRFLFVTRDPYDLYFAKLDGTRLRLAEGVERFAAAAVPCQDVSELTASGQDPAYLSVAPNTPFVKTWRLRNSGTCAWNASYRLAFVDGERLSGPHRLPLGETVPPGGEIKLSVNLVAPANPGTYQGEWQLIDPQGMVFGTRAAVDIDIPSFTEAELTPDQVVAKIPAAAGPIALGEGALWSLSGNAVSRVDLDTNQVVARIPIGEFPAAIVTGYGAVWASANGTISRIDPLTNQISATIPLAPSTALECLVASQGSIWVCNRDAGLINRIDPATNQVFAGIPLDPGPMRIAVTEGAIWAITLEGLKRVDPQTNEVTADIPLDCLAKTLYMDDTGVWVPCYLHPVLYRIDPLTNQVVARIGVRAFGVAPATDTVWVTSHHGLIKIDAATNQIEAVYRVGENPGHVIVAQGELFVATQSDIWRIRP